MYASKRGGQGPRDGRPDARNGAARGSGVASPRERRPKASRSVHATRRRRSIRPGARRRLGVRTIASPAVISTARTRPSGRNIPARLGYGLWHLFTSVDFAVFQIIFLALLAVVGMTIKQLPDFAFRSATDYALAMDATARPLRPGHRGGRRGRDGAALAVRRLPLPVVQPRPGRARHIDHRLHARPDAAAVARCQRYPGRPARAVLRPAPAGSRRDGRGGRPTTLRGVLRRNGLPRARGDRSGRNAISLRRSSPVHQDGDAVHASRADPVPGRGRGDVPARG